MSFLLKKGDSLVPTSDDLSTKDINPERDIPKLDVFKDIESEDEDNCCPSHTTGMGNVQVSDSKVNCCLFSLRLIFIVNGSV